MMVRTRNAKSKWEKTLVGLAIATFFVVIIQFELPVVDRSDDVLKSSKQDFIGLPSSTSVATTTTDVTNEKASFSLTSESSIPIPMSIPIPSNQQQQPAYHIVFSTSCTPQMDWESMVFFYHAMKVQQPGNITRIVSGCDDQQAQKLLTWHTEHIQKAMSSSFHVHFTPDFSRVRLSEGKHAYKYMNKPFGLKHWMENGLGMNMNIAKGENATTTTTSSTDSDLRDGIVILMDPDMILLRPLLHDFTNEEVIWVDSDTTGNTKHSVGEPLTKVVRHGFPMAQQDGYLNNEWMKLNFSYIVDQPSGSYVTRPVWGDGPLHWNTGPPYLATVGDMYKIVNKWTEYAPRVLGTLPLLLDCHDVGNVSNSTLSLLPLLPFLSRVLYCTVGSSPVTDARLLRLTALFSFQIVSFSFRSQTCSPNCLPKCMGSLLRPCSWRCPLH
jgi:hypothetical protein